MMAYLLFVDESGQDHHASPYEVLCGAAVHDTELWDLVCEIQDAEFRYFGARISDGRRELKARRLLKRKAFKHARQYPSMRNPERAFIAARALSRGPQATREDLAGLAQAKIAFAEHVLERCEQHNVRLFASIVEPDAARPAGKLLRKDYAYLFERFYYFIEHGHASERGLVIFDELERSQSHILVGQMAAYFRETANGRARSTRIVPEPFFVHSDLTTGIQLADIAAYVISWYVRFGGMSAPRREELSGMGQRLLRLREHSTIPRRLSRWIQGLELRPYHGSSPSGGTR